MKAKRLTISLAAALCAFALIVFAFAAPITAYAEDGEPDTEISTVAPDTEPATAGDTVESNPTFWGRIWEWVKDNYAGVIATVGEVGVAVLLIVYQGRSKKRHLEALAPIISTNNTQGDIVDVVNQLIKSNNELEKRLDSYEKRDVAVMDAAQASCIQTKAVLEILSRVYVNSKNIPQGVKDLVNLEYVRARKLLGEDDSSDNAVLPEVQEGDDNA